MFIIISGIIVIIHHHHHSAAQQHELFFFFFLFVTQRAIQQASTSTQACVGFERPPAGMFTQWATRRLCKFLLKKRLGRYIRGDLDLEQLDVQLGSGTVQLNDLALNTDYVNEQLADLPVVLKEGSLGSVTLKLHWKLLAAIDIEVDEVELVLTPRKGAESFSPKHDSSPFDDSTSANTGLDCEFDGLASSGGCTYLPVQEGVRVVANLVERLLLGLHVRVRHAILAFEELPSSSKGSTLGKENNHVSHSMLVIRVGNAEYGIDSFSSPDDSCSMKDSVGVNSVVLTNAVRFQDMTMEVLDIRVAGSECPSCTVLGEKTGGGKVFGKPVPILLGDEGLSGCVQLSMPWKSGCLNIPKLNADISISQVKLQLTGNEIQRLLNVASSFGDGGHYNVANAQSCGANQSSILNNNGLLVVKPTDDRKEMPSPSCLLPEMAMVGSQSKPFGPAVLPVTRLISDWAHWNGGDNHENVVEAMSEADFAASTDEFFECFDGTRSSQASLSGSGLWTWTCSAFTAITAASSLASGSVLISQDSPKKVEYDFTFKIPGVSVVIVLEETPNIAHNELGMHPEHSRDCHLETWFSNIDLSLQVSQGHLEFEVRVDFIEAFEVESRLMQDVGLPNKQSAPRIVEEICSSSQSFQALVENALPEFSVSLCAGMEAYQRHSVTTNCSNKKGCLSCEGSKFETGGALADYRKKWVLRLSTLGNLAAVNMIVKQDFSSSDNKDKDPNSSTHTKLEVHLQPLIVWLDASLFVKIHKLVDIFTCSTSDSEAGVFFKKSDSHFDRSIHCSSAFCASNRCVKDVDLFIPCLRILACLPHASGSSLMKDNLLCLDLCTSTNSKNPLIAAKLYDTLCGKQTSPHSITLVLQDISLYLVSPLIHVEDPMNHSLQSEDLAFFAHRIFSFSEFNHKPATLELKLKGKSSGGTWLTERAWNGVIEQQKGGMGGSENGKMNCEFAAATATEVLHEKNSHMREDIQSCSSVCLHISIPYVRFEVFGSQHLVVLGLIRSIMDLFAHQSDQLRLKTTDFTSNSEGQGLSLPEVNDQISISVDVGKVEIGFHPKLAETEARQTPHRAEDHPWDSLRIIANKLQLLYVLNLGMIRSASYFWVSHEDGHIKGLLAETNSLEVSLLTCRNDALGRGDGGGGNALARSSAGCEITVIAWPDGHHPEDVLISATLRGATVVAHGGRLDWLPASINFFCQALDKDSTQRAIHVKGCSPTAEVSLIRLEHSTFECEDVPSENCTFFSLDLHDVALSYEPGEEASLAANIRARGMAEAPASVMEFTPVACILAAAVVRVSSNAISSTNSKEYGIWLRDVALLLVDTTLRRHWLQDYTTDALHQAGYVKVAREAVMEAVVRINSDEGLQWEVECANNQLRLDTCHDTTAALGRLVAQLQQLFAPDIEHSAIPQQVRTTSKDVDACCAGDCFTVMSEDLDNDLMSFSNVVNDEKKVIFDGMLGDPFTFVRDGSSNLDTSANTSLSCDHVESETVSSELLGRFELLGRSGLSSDDAAEESHCSSLDHGSSDGQNQDFWAPLSENDGLPSFIEDYYVTKNSSLHSSRSSSCNDSGEILQHVPVYANEFGTLNTTEGSGGWYEGHMFRVVENHVPEVNTRSGSQKQRGSLSHPANKRFGLATEYPQSVGRVALQGLNVRWRLYGGSDWTQDELGLSHAHKGGRQLGVCLEVILDGVELQYDTFSETSSYASRLTVSIRDIRVYDCSKDAPWKKVLGYHKSKSHPRESSAQALKLELESVRPDPLVPLEEYRLSVHLLPILLHLDQRHLDFFIKFFPPSSPCVSPQLHSSYEEICALNTTGLKGSNLGTKTPDVSDEALLPFFQTCELQPFTIRVDYIPRRVDIAALRGGNYAELFNLVSWKGIELQLKHVRAAGVHGWGALSGIVVGEWLEDISRNQIHKLIRGLGPIRPLFAVGSGAAKLIALPAEHYKRDRRRLLRGMQKGAIAFLRSISLEAVGLGVQLAAGAHEILRHTESALGAVALSGSLASEKGEMSNKVNQPGDVREGLQQACESFSRGLERTASSLIGNPLKVYQRGSGTGLAVASALRAAPAAAVAPASAAAGAVHRALLGVRNSLDPEHRRESEEKHTGPPPD